MGDPPVLIPNTEVKPQNAYGTWLDTARKSKVLPHPLKTPMISRSFFCGKKGKKAKYGAKQDVRAVEFGTNCADISVIW